MNHSHLTRHEQQCPGKPYFCKYCTTVSATYLRHFEISKSSIVFISLSEVFTPRIIIFILPVFSTNLYIKFNYFLKNHINNSMTSENNLCPQNKVRYCNHQLKREETYCEMTFQIFVSEIYSLYFKEPISREDITKLNFQAYLKAAKNAKLLTSRVMKVLYHITLG